MTLTGDDELAGALAAAHRSGDVVAFAGRAAPADFDAAFAIQARVARELGAEIFGWKAGFGPGNVPVAAPIHRAYAAASGAAVVLPRHTPLIVEVEIGFRLARDLPPRATAYSRDDILSAVAEVVIGLELIASRYGDHSAVPFPAFLADNLGNAGYVIGESRREFRGLDFSALRCALDVDGKTTHDRVGGHPQNDPLLPLLAWSNAQRDGLGGLRAGQIVTTGSLTPIFRFDKATRLHARVENIGVVTATLGR